MVELDSPGLGGHIRAVCGSDDASEVPRSTFYARRKREEQGLPVRSKGRPSQWGTPEEEEAQVIRILQTSQKDPVSARWLKEHLPRGMSASVKTALRWLRKWGFLLQPPTPAAGSEQSVAESLPVVHAWVRPPEVADEWMETRKSWMVIVARDGKGTERFLMVTAESPEDETVQKAITKLRSSKQPQ